MLKRFAIAAALLICAGLLPIQGVHAATQSSQATVIAQALRHGERRTGALSKGRCSVAQYPQRHLPLQR
jgi:hypothetical protein